MRILPSYLAGSILLTTVAGGIHKISDIFDVVMTGDDSCAKYYDPKAPVDRPGQKRLNQYWYQLGSWIETAYTSLEPQEYKKNLETRKLVQNMFGIIPVTNGLPPAAGLQGQAYTKLRDWHKRLYDYTHVNLLPKDRRPILACGGKFVKLVKETDPLLGPDGKPQRDGKGNIIKFSTWFDKNEAKGSMRFDTSWLFYLSVEGHYTGPRPKYLGPDGHLMASPYWALPPNRQTGEVDYCDGFPVAGVTFSVPGKHFNLDSKDPFAMKRDVLTLCPVSFMLNDEWQAYKGYPTGPLQQRVAHELDLYEQPAGKELQKMGIPLITLYHELVHLVIGDNLDDMDLPGMPPTPDAAAWGALRDENHHISQDFPKHKSGFIKKYPNAAGPIQCMYTSLYNIAEPQWKHIGEWTTIKMPNCYAWFALAQYLQVHGGKQKDGSPQKRQDWSRGIAQKAGTPYGSVYYSEKVFVSDGLFVP